MKENTWAHTVVQGLKTYGLSLALFGAVVWLLFGGLTTAEQTSQEESLRMVEQSITRAMVTCYAIEGVYPESFAYLEQNYGLYIDSDKYAVGYMAFASNMMPTVTVLEVSP